MKAGIELCCKNLPSKYSSLKVGSLTIFIYRGKSHCISHHISAFMYILTELKFGKVIVVVVIVVVVGGGFLHLFKAAMGFNFVRCFSFLFCFVFFFVCLFDFL